MLSRQVYCLIGYKVKRRNPWRKRIQNWISVLHWIYSAATNYLPGMITTWWCNERHLLRKLFSFNDLSMKRRWRLSPSFQHWCNRMPHFCALQRLLPFSEHSLITVQNFTSTFSSLGEYWLMSKTMSRW